MANVSNIIWETCKTYLFTQGKFLAILWVLIAACMIYYFMVLQHNTFGRVVIILGIHSGNSGITVSPGSESESIPSLIPAPLSPRLRATRSKLSAFRLRSGMSVGLLLVAVEIVFMICF